MTNPPLTFKCAVGGEEWPATSYRCTIDALVGEVKPRHVHFWCPANHDFTLRKATVSGMLTKEQAGMVLRQARRQVDSYRRGEREVKEV